MGGKIKAAGGVVVHGKKILFIKKNGRWEFPKGRLKKGDKKKKPKFIKFDKKENPFKKLLSLNIK